MSQQCAEFDRRLQRQLDRRRSPQSDRRLLRHARHCAACRQMLAAQTLVSDQLALTGRRVPPRGLAARVLAGRQSERAARWWHAPSWKYVAALAAALLLAAWQGGYRGAPAPRSFPGAKSERVASERGYGDAPRRPASEHGDARDLLSPAVLATSATPSPAARQRLKLLAAETGQNLAAVVLRLPGVRSQSIGGEPGAVQDSPWVESVTGSLKPFAESLSDAVAPWLESAPPAERTPRS
jgi:hypothetical protein